MVMISPGRYSLIYPSGDYRTVRVKLVKNGGLAGATIVALKVGSEFQGCAFLDEQNQLRFWRRFREANSPDRLLRIQRAVDRIADDPEGAGLAYALRENRCYRCDRALTVPASVSRGLGPECAGKVRWQKADQRAVYDDLEMKRQFAAHERRQEQLGFASDPDYRRAA